MPDYSVPSPATIATTGVQLGFMDGVPLMMAGERPFWGFMYTFDPYDNRPFLAALRSMYAHGVRLFSFLLPLPVAWDQPGTYDFTLIDELHAKLLEAAPEGLFYPRVFVNTPDWWDAANPDELIGFRGTRPAVYPNGNEHLPLWKYECKIYHETKNASFASQKWRADASAVLAAYVRRTWQGACAGHWIGYQIAYGCQGEWIPFGTFIHNQFGSFDISPPMLAAFRADLTAKYGSDQALQQAWRQPTATLATAVPPTKLQLLRSDLGIFKDPQNCQHAADWVELHTREMYDAMLHFGRAVKAAAPRPVLTGAFVGYRMQLGASAYTTHLAETRLNRLLDHDAIDILSTPNWYVDRQKGIYSQAPIATIARKKLFLAENDVRTHLASATANVYGCGCDSNPTDSLHQFLRDTFFDFVQGGGQQWWYDFGHGWYLDPVFEQIVARLVAVSARITPAERAGQAEVAVVVDEESTAYHEGSVGYLRLFKECLNEQLPRMGAPFDCITTDDMLARPPYKLYIFRDMFYVPAEKRARLRDFLTANRAAAVWLHGAGLLGENGIDPAGMELLTGIKCQLLDTLTSQQLSVTDFSHPLASGVPRTVGSLGNDDLRGVYAPTLYVDDPRADCFGRIESVDLPGMAVRRQAGRFDAWFASPLLPYQLLANLAREAGVHRYVEPGTVLFGQGRLFSLQHASSGPLLLTPPTAVQAGENLLTGVCYPGDHNRIWVDLKAGEPVLLRLIPGHPPANQK